MSYELHLQTSAGGINFFTSPKRKFVDDILAAISAVISNRDASNIYIADIKNNQVYGNKNEIINSPGSISVGGDAKNISQKNNISGQILGNIAELQQISNMLSSPEREEILALIANVRTHIARGERGKADATTAWDTLVSRLGSATGLASGAWDLVAKIGDALHG